MRIIPAIDIIDGKCVRLTQGDYSQKKVYNQDPLEEALRFEDAGIRFLHLVDLDGARSGGVVNYAVLEKIASRTSLNIDFGGGVKTEDHLRRVLDCGACQVTGGSIAVRSPERFKAWISQYGPDKVILGADARNGKIAIQGWEEESTVNVLPFISGYAEQGVRYVICTDIARDGMLEGPAVSLYQEIISELPEINLIASGGVSGIEDLQRLKSIGCEGVIIGKAFYEKKIQLKEIEKYLLNAH